MDKVTIYTFTTEKRPVLIAKLEGLDICRIDRATKNTAAFIYMTDQRFNKWLLKLPFVELIEPCVDCIRVKFRPGYIAQFDNHNTCIEVYRNEDINTMHTTEIDRVTE